MSIFGYGAIGINQRTNGSTTYTYEEVKYPVQRRGNCEECGKSRSRSTTMKATINPFNKNDKGEPKTRSEVIADLAAQADAWVPDFTCMNHE